MCSQARTCGRIGRRTPAFMPRRGTAAMIAASIQQLFQPAEANPAQVFA
jgi:hypothetical protein